MILKLVESRNCSHLFNLLGQIGSVHLDRTPVLQNQSRMKENNWWVSELEGCRTGMATKVQEEAPLWAWQDHSEGLG